ncbi:uncharacterized protein [Ptychodera flava]|uniref:uncharacterized protein n=1 Tax=Ptychodera flava TaxID=63121 RepID=UPI003969DAD6
MSQPSSPMHRHGREAQRHAATAELVRSGAVVMTAKVENQRRRDTAVDLNDNLPHPAVRATEAGPELENVDNGERDSRLVLPVNLSEKYADHMGYRHVCGVDFDDLQFLYTTSLNKPVMIENRVFPAVVVRIWSRASGKYVRLLEKTDELYGRSVFGSSGHFKMLFVKPSVVMLRSTSNTQQFLTINDHRFVGKGHGGKESELIVRQSDAGYCYFESFTHRGHFLGVRSNGNVVRADRVRPNDLEAQFVVQKEAMDICKLRSKFDL